ncbi:hypothetical protein [Mycoplasmopsis columbina]|uniref:hypothetical protein n=1 Tax=Mycoplasmopsis columbina TaxID=114881 RepID=UPI0004A73DD1|nr:hypothetical protein [Mycoplasmopsis columbina]VEU76967.1 Uncharacterised protein [Mycoplasmopsis columbina]
MKLKNKFIGILTASSAAILPLVALSAAPSNLSEYQEQNVGALLEQKTELESFSKYFDETIKTLIEKTENSQISTFLGFDKIKSFVETYKAEVTKFGNFIEAFKTKDKSWESTWEEYKLLANMSTMLSNWKDALLAISKDVVDTLATINTLDEKQLAYQEVYFKNYKTLLETIDEKLKPFRTPEAYTNVDSYTIYVAKVSSDIAATTTAAISKRKSNDLKHIIQDLNKYITLLKTAADSSKSYTEKVDTINETHNTNNAETASDSAWFGTSKSELISLLTKLHNDEETKAACDEFLQQVNTILKDNAIDVTLDPNNIETSVNNLDTKLKEMIALGQATDEEVKGAQRNSLFWVYVILLTLLVILLILTAVVMIKKRSYEKRNQELKSQI